MASRNARKMAVLLASAAWPALAHAQVAGSDTSADQIAPARAPVSAEQIGGAGGSLAVPQLPANLRPLARGEEEKLAAPSGPPATLTAEVLAAWNVIRTRGLVPTPDLIAREIGPGKLAEFLATSPGAASILATGHEPDPRPADPMPDQEKGAVVKTVLPPGHS